MKFSEQWLREWVNPAVTSSQLAQQLTLVGLEVESTEPVAGSFSGVVIGEVLSTQQHPDADRLRVCQVAVGDPDALTIVCGGQNVRAGLKVPVAKINAVLGADFKIKKSKLRGVESHGMICSEGELGLPVVTEGIMELPADAPIGMDIREYLQLNDIRRISNA
jgi:phenylalanyl-tRNA synthetase beta chain